MRCKKGLIIQQIEDEYILADSGIEKPRFNGMVKLNETSKFIVDELMNNDFSLDELIIKMLEVYDTTKEELEKTISPIISQLEGIGIIKK